MTLTCHSLQVVFGPQALQRDEVRNMHGEVAGLFVDFRVWGFVPVSGSWDGGFSMIAWES